MKMNQTNVNEMRKKKSERLSREEIKSLKSFCRSFPFVVECADVIGISRQVLDRVLMLGSGSPETIKKVKAALLKAESESTAA